MAQFAALETAFEVARLVGPLLKPIAACNADLSDQLSRAVTSAVSCLAEGRKRAGKDRLHLFRCAEGSAAEAHVQIRLAQIFGHIEEALAEPAIQAADRLVALCYGLTHSKKHVEQ